MDDGVIKDSSRSPLLCGFLALTACATPGDDATLSVPPQPRQIVDLGTLVTENLARDIWGERYVRERGFDRPNVFEITRTELYEGALTLQNGYYTLFNHGGPHVDAPNHVGLEGGIDSYPIDAFSGPLKVLDVSGFQPGRTVTVDTFEDSNIQPGDVVLIYTGYARPPSGELPREVTLTWEAAEYLASIPIRAFGTDARSVASLAQQGQDDPTAANEPPAVRAGPVHYAFLSRGIPIYEQLFNLSALLGEDKMFFTGSPVNVDDGDGMVVRPVVFLY